MYCALDSSKRKITIAEALPEINYFCPLCGKEVRLRTDKFHMPSFHHLVGRCEDPWVWDSHWAEYWLNLIPKDLIDTPIEWNGEKHLLAVRSQNTGIMFWESKNLGTLDFSYPTKFFQSECGNMIWVFNAYQKRIDAVKGETIFPLDEKSQVKKPMNIRLLWHWWTKSLQNIVSTISPTNRVFFHFNDNLVFELKGIDEATSQLECLIMPVEATVAELNQVIGLEAQKIPFNHFDGIAKKKRTQYDGLFIAKKVREENRTDIPNFRKLLNDFRTGAIDEADMKKIISPWKMPSADNQYFTDKDTPTWIDENLSVSDSDEEIAYKETIKSHVDRIQDDIDGGSPDLSIRKSILLPSIIPHRNRSKSYAKEVKRVCKNAASSGFDIKSAAKYLESAHIDCEAIEQYGLLDCVKGVIDSTDDNSRPNTDEPDYSSVRFLFQNDAADDESVEVEWADLFDFCNRFCPYMVKEAEVMERKVLRAFERKKQAIPLIWKTIFSASGKKYISSAYHGQKLYAGVFVWNRRTYYVPLWPNMNAWALSILTGRPKRYSDIHLMEKDLFDCIYNINKPDGDIRFESLNRLIKPTA